MLSPGPRGPPLWLREINRRGTKTQTVNRNRRPKTIMVMMSADLNDANPLGALPKGWQTARIDPTAFDGEAKSKATEAPMMNITFIIETGEYAKKRVFPPDHVMLGGVTEKGDKQNLDRLCQYINACHVEWKCLGCLAIGVRKFVKNEQLQKWVCPDCRQVAAFAYDTDHFKDKVVKILLDQEKGYNSDEMVNRVVRVAELT